MNDGSQDATGQIADAAAKEYPWITVIHRPQGSNRRLGGGVIDAFYAGLNDIDLDEFDYICKLDGDLEFGSQYFEILYQKFDANPALGTASGKCYLPVGEQLVLERSGDDFSHGVAKLYRTACFKSIGGFVREVMWDGIDCHRCRQLGWTASSFSDPALRITHLRMMGSSDRGVIRGRIRWGRGQYFMGTHPLYLLGIAAYRMAERPWIIGGLCILWGYLRAWGERQPQYSLPGFREHLHYWQLRQLLARLPSPKSTAVAWAEREER